MLSLRAVKWLCCLLTGNLSIFSGCFWTLSHCLLFAMMCPGVLYLSCLWLLSFLNLRIGIFVLENFFSYYLFIYCFCLFFFHLCSCGTLISCMLDHLCSTCLLPSVLFFPFSFLIVLQFGYLSLTCLLLTKSVLCRLDPSNKFLVLDVFFSFQMSTCF